MIDFRALHDELIHGLILREYGRAGGTMASDFDKKAVDHYRDNAIFRMEIDGLAAGIMQLVQKYNKEI